MSPRAYNHPPMKSPDPGLRVLAHRACTMPALPDPEEIYQWDCPICGARWRWYPYAPPNPSRRIGSPPQPAYWIRMKAGLEIWEPPVEGPSDPLDFSADLEDPIGPLE